MAGTKKLPARLKRRSGRAVNKAVAKTKSGIQKVPGPSPNAATNVLIAEILVRSAGRVARRTMEKGLLSAKFQPEEATAIVEGRGIAHSLVSATVARVATRSVPGALLVGGGMVVKTLYDRTISRRKARRRGEKTLAKQEAKADKTML